MAHTPSPASPAVSGAGRERRDKSSKIADQPVPAPDELRNLPIRSNASRSPRSPPGSPDRIRRDRIQTDHSRPRDLLSNPYRYYGPDTDGASSGERGSPRAKASERVLRFAGTRILRNRDRDRNGQKRDVQPLRGHLHRRRSRRNRWNRRSGRHRRLGCRRCRRWRGGRCGGRRRPRRRGDGWRCRGRHHLCGRRRCRRDRRRGRCRTGKRRNGRRRWRRGRCARARHDGSGRHRGQAGHNWGW